MISLLRGHVGDAAAPFVFVAVFLIIGGLSLWITPRLAAWMDKKASENKSYYDGMLTEDPNKSKPGVMEPEKPEENDDGKTD